MKIRRGRLIRSNREYLIRLATYLKLNFENIWSNKHIASLIYWRITRSEINRH